MSNTPLIKPHSETLYINYFNNIIRHTQFYNTFLNQSLPTTNSMTTTQITFPIKQGHSPYHEDSSTAESSPVKKHQSHRKQPVTGSIEQSLVDELLRLREQVKVLKAENMKLLEENKKLQGLVLRSNCVSSEFIEDVEISPIGSENGGSMWSEERAEDFFNQNDGNPCNPRIQLYKSQKIESVFDAKDWKLPEAKQSQELGIQTKEIEEKRSLGSGADSEKIQSLERENLVLKTDILSLKQYLSFQFSKIKLIQDVIDE